MSSRGLVIALLGFLILAIIGMASCAFFLGSMLTGPSKAADQWLMAISQSEFDRAYSETTRDFQVAITRQAMEKEMTRLGMQSFKVAVWRQTSIQNNEATVTGEIERKDGSKFPCTIRLKKVNDKWLVGAFDST